MELLINHYSCHRPYNSIEEKPYYSSYSVKIEMFPMDSEYSAYVGKNPDFTSIIDFDIGFFNEVRYNRLIKRGWDDEKSRISVCGDATNRLKPHVIKWLEENIKDRKDDNYPKGYSYGDDATNCDAIDFSILFHRKNDAMNFIKEFSLRKKPTFYFDYFKDIRKTLNEDGTYSPME